ncbi:hypothetical protein [Sphingomonas sp. 1P08PE]|uniref:hypothetical protein n=1 Tax=Sphingomonas sp. 1P08PE TaxID=554122 RepID=UPI0039A35AE5
MFRFITRTEHDRVVRQLADSDSANRKLFNANVKLIRERNDLRAQLAKVHTTRGPGGRFVKREERQS